MTRAANLLVVTLLVTLTSFAPFSRRTAAQELNAEQVRLTIKRGADYLLRQQSNDGRWISRAESGYPYGSTCLVTLALLNAGIPADHPKIQLAIEGMIERLPERKLTTYTCSLKTMVLATADPKGKLYSREIQQCVNMLIDQQFKKGKHTGGWTYPRNHTTPDGSNSQFALLALHEAKKVGANIPEAVSYTHLTLPTKA